MIKQKILNYIWLFHRKIIQPYNSGIRIVIKVCSRVSIILSYHHNNGIWMVDLITSNQKETS
jgi:hypothetical protein